MIFVLLSTLLFIGCSDKDAGDSAPSDSAADSAADTDSATDSVDDTDSATGDSATDSVDDTDSATDTAAVTVSYATDVWPILEANCVSCHTNTAYHPGFDLSTIDAAYTTLTTDTPDLPDAALKAYIVPGDPDASIFIDKNEHATPIYGGSQMPMNANYQGSTPLPAEQQALMRTWVLEGAAKN